MLEAATQGAGARAEEERAKAEARVADLAKKRRVAEEATKAQADVRGKAAAGDWTATYRAWADWEDPDELAAKEAEERERLEKISKRVPTTCSHDHAAERAIYEMSIDEQLAACRRFKARGNLFFKEGQFGLAAEQYRKVTIYYEYAFPDTDEQQKEIDSIRVHCLTNFSACAMRLGALEDAVDYCEQALYSDPGNVKALYRRAQAYRHLDKFAEARRDIEAALAAAPNDSAIQREARSLSNSERAYALRSKGVGKAMFSAKKSASAAGGGGGGGAAEESERAGVDGVAQDAEGHEGAVRDLMETTDDSGSMGNAFVTSDELLKGGGAANVASQSRRYPPQGAAAATKGSDTKESTRGGGSTGGACDDEASTRELLRRLAEGDTPAKPDATGADVDDDGWTAWRKRAEEALAAQSPWLPSWWVVAAASVAVTAAALTNITT